MGYAADRSGRAAGAARAGPAARRGAATTTTITQPGEAPF